MKNILKVTLENANQIKYSLNNSKLNLEKTQMNTGVLYTFIVLNYKHKFKKSINFSIKILEYRAELVTNFLNELNRNAKFSMNNSIDLNYLDNKLLPENLVELILNKSPVSSLFSISYIENNYPFYLI
jgi:hypothetical protein